MYGLPLKLGHQNWPLILLLSANSLSHFGMANFISPPLLSSPHNSFILNRWLWSLWCGESLICQFCLVDFLSSVFSCHYTCINPTSVFTTILLFFFFPPESTSFVLRIFLNIQMEGEDDRDVWIWLQGKCLIAFFFLCDAGVSSAPSLSPSFETSLNQSFTLSCIPSSSSSTDNLPLVWLICSSLYPLDISQLLS